MRAHPGSWSRRPAELRAWPGVALSCALLLAACTDDDGPAAVPADAARDAAQLPGAPGDAGPDAAVDAADVDAAVVDAAVDAAEAPDTAARPDAPAPYPRPSYTLLSKAGLYSDPAAKTIAADLIYFAPTHVLWSDGAHKRRWIRLPPGTRMDTSDMDHWVPPVGTQFWKEFSSPEGVLLETRLIEHYGSGPEDYWMGSFVWNAEQTDATFAVDGAMDINGTKHDAPAQKLCGACHRGDKGRSLGFSAIQLSRPAREPGDVTLQSLALAGLLSDPPPPGVDYPVPGDATTAAALGYFHANCGHCHNLNGTSWPDTQMVLRLRVNERAPQDTELWKTVLNGTLQAWRGHGYDVRIAPGHPERSGILARMRMRGSRDQMPPLATEFVDQTGVDTITRWVSSLPAPADAGP